MKPIRVRLKRALGDGMPKGAELGYASVADANREAGEDGYTILSYTDGSEYVAPERTTDGPATETTDEPKAKKG